MRTFLLAAFLVVPLSALAQDEAPPPPEEKAEEKKEEKAEKEEKKDAGPFSAGRFVVRGGLSFDLNQSFNLGGPATTAARITLGANGGVGYFIIPKLSLDVDLRFLAYLTPTPEVAWFEVTPGARYNVVDNLVVRVGVPIPILPRFGVGVLGGVAYHQPLGSRAALVVGVDYTYYLTDYYKTVAPLGRVDVHGGVQTWF